MSSTRPDGVVSVDTGDVNAGAEDVNRTEVQGAVDNTYAANVSNDEEKVKNGGDGDDDDDDDEVYHSLPSSAHDSVLVSSGSGSGSGRGKLVGSILLVVLFCVFSTVASFFVLSRYPIIPVTGVNSNNERYMEFTRDSEDKKIHITQRDKMDKDDSSLLLKGPSIVWLFAYPQSGATQILHLLHVVSKKASATNYGHMVMDSRGVVGPSPQDSVRVYGDSGPALFTLNALPPPTEHILTWTATDGACRDCHPRNYMYNYKRFRTYCWHGTVQHNQEQVQYHYDAQRVVATVHLMRYPFDNVLLRFWAEREDKAAHGHETFVNKFPPTEQGFQDWCGHMDQDWYDVERAWYGDEVWTFLEEGDVVCRQEFYKYVMFHNNAVRMREGPHLPNMNLKYEDLSTGYYRTIGKLVSFLELPVVSPAPDQDVQLGFSKHYFTDKQRESTFAFMQQLALPKVKHVLEDYQNMEL